MESSLEPSADPNIPPGLFQAYDIQSFSIIRIYIVESLNSLVRMLNV